MKEIGEEKQEQFRQRCFKESGLTYSMACALPVLLSIILVIVASAVEGAQETNVYRYFTFLIPQICFAAAAGIYFYRTKEPLRKTYSTCKWYYFLIAFVLQFGIFICLSQLNVYFIKLFELMGYKEQETALPALNGWNLLPAILVIALLPAVFEETIFRGIISRNMNENGWGVMPTVLIAGAMFSLFHGNPSQTVYQFICGMCFTLLALRAGSILPTMLAHFANNAVILILTSVYNPPDNQDLSVGDLMSSGAYIATCVISALCLVGSLVYLIFFDKRNGGGKGVKQGKTFFFMALVGIVVCAIEWFVTLATGFMPND